MQLPQLSKNCHLRALTWPTTVGAVGFCAHFGIVALRSFKRIATVSAEHERLAFCGGAQEREAHGRTGLGWLLSTLYPFSHARGLLLLSSSCARWILTLGLARYRANLWAWVGCSPLSTLSLTREAYYYYLPLRSGG